MFIRVSPVNPDAGQERILLNAEFVYRADPYEDGARAVLWLSKDGADFVIVEETFKQVTNLLRANFVPTEEERHRKMAAWTGGGKMPGGNPALRPEGT